MDRSWSLFLCLWIALAGVKASTPEGTIEQIGPPFSTLLHEPAEEIAHLSNEVQSINYKEGRSIWNTRFFKKISRLFNWNRNDKLKKRTSFLKRRQLFPLDFMTPPIIGRKEEVSLNKKHKSVHPYKYVISKPSKQNAKYESSYHKILAVPPKPKPLTNSYPSTWKDSLQAGHRFSSKLNRFPKNKIYPKKSPSKKRSPPEKLSSMQVPITRSRVPVVAYYPRRDEFTIPATNQRDSFPVSSELSVHYTKSHLPNPYIERKEKNGLLDNISSFTTNMLEDIFPNSFSKRDKRKRNNRPAFKRPIPRPFPIRVPLRSSRPSANSVKLEERNFDYLVPSPQEGSFTADAFQPIFVPSQSLDSVMGSDAMKPMIIAESRIAPIKKEPTPPELLDFF